MEDMWLTADVISKYLSITKDTICNWSENRNVPAHKFRRRWMFQKYEIDVWIKRHKASDEK